MAADDRTVALNCLRQLRECLAENIDEPARGRFVDDVDHLVRAVDSFHMEAVRFRLFGLRRLMTAHEGSLPPAVGNQFDAAVAAIAAAGFRTT